MEVLRPVRRLLPIVLSIVADASTGLARQLMLSAAEAGGAWRCAIRATTATTSWRPSRAIGVRAWMAGKATAYTADSAYLPTTGITEIPFIWDDTVSSGALVDSLEIALDFEDSDTLEFEDFTVRMVSPKGTQELLYDGGELGDLDLSLYDVYVSAGEPVAGTWKLVIERNNPQGYISSVNSCELDMDYLN